MNDKPLACEIPTLPEGTNRQRIQVFPGPGKYVHPSSGEFELTRESLDEFAADINSRDTIPIDRDHAFYKGLPAPAAGWFVPGTAEATDEGVFAETDWNDTAAEQIRKREYRLISPEFSFGHRKPDGGKIPEPRLLAATLTNRPFFTMMAPIAAEDFDALEGFVEDGVISAADVPEGIEAEEAARLIAAADSKMPYGKVAYADPGYQKDGKKRYPIDTEEHCRAAWSYINQKRNAARYSSDQLSRIKSRIKRAATKLGITIGADSTAGGDMDLTVVAEALGITAEDADETKVSEALAAIVAENADLKKKLEAAPGDEQMKVLLASAAKGEAAATKLAEMEKKTTLDSAIRDGKIVAAERDTYAGFYDIDPEGTVKLLAEMKPRITMEPRGHEHNLTVADLEVTADTTPVAVNGVEMSVGEEGAKIHAAAVAMLDKQNVAADDPAYAEKYVAASMKAAKELGIDLAERHILG